MLDSGHALALCYNFAMAHGLLISDHELLNDLYGFNLQAYVDLSLTIKDSIDEALQIIELGASGEVIICLSQIGGRDVALEVHEKMAASDSKATLIIIGSKSKLSGSDGIITLPPNMNIGQLVKTCAKVLGVTAQDMIKKPVPAYYPVPLTILQSFDVAPCDIYIKVTRSAIDSDFMTCLEKEQPMSGKMDQYKQKGVANLYIPSELRLSIVNMASASVLKQLDNPKLSSEEKVKVAEQAYDIVGGLLGESTEVTPEVVAISKKCVETVKDVISTMPKLKNLLTGMLANKTGYLYLHCVMGTYVSRHVIQNISWGSDEHSEKQIKTCVRHSPH